MNRETYNPRVASTFEIIACYIVDVFYNHFYSIAKNKAKLSLNPSITDEYKKAVLAYNIGISHTPEYYKKTIKALHEYYKCFTKYADISLLSFQDNILSQYIPEEYYESYSESQKDDALYKIITDIIAQFCIVVLEIDNLKNIIDDHANESNTRLLVDNLVIIQMRKREEIFVKFAKKFNGDNSNEMVPIDSVKQVENENRKLKTEFKKLLAEKCQLEVKLDQANITMSKLIGEIKSYRAQVRPLSPPRVIPVARQQTTGPILQQPVQQLTQEPIQLPQQDRTKEINEEDEDGSLDDLLSSELIEIKESIERRKKDRAERRTEVCVDGDLEFGLID